MKLFLAVVAFHFLEHLAQLWQLYVLQWQRPQCLGLIGMWQPWLVRSEWLHYLYAVVMLIGLYLLRKNLGSRWWTTAIYLQQFHHLEHLLLLFQALLGVAMINRTSIGGLFFPRLELHFFYNLMVMIPMMIALWKTKKFGVSL